VKVELHLHTMRYSGCAIATPAELMAEYIAAEYEAVFITEHDAVWLDWELEELRQQFPAIRIFSGVEVTVGWNPLQHLLVLGTTDAAYLELPDARSVIERARDQGCLTVAAHPFRWDGAGALLEGDLLPDAIECRSCNHDKKQGKRSAKAAEELHLPMVNGGDVHDLTFIDHFWIETSGPLERGEDIRRIVQAGEYENRQRK
jgi:hypothetical protein